MMKILMIVVASWFLLVAFGCDGGYPSCGYTCQNDSDRLVRVDSITGMKINGAIGNAGGGNLIPGGSKTIKGQSHGQVSGTVRIEWWIVDDTKPHDPSQNLVANFPIDEYLPRNSNLVFSLEQDGKWAVSVKRH